jgi:hypothetical protein
MKPPSRCSTTRATAKAAPLAGRSQHVRPLHHARITGSMMPPSTATRIRSSDAGRHRDPLRDDPRDTDHPARWPPARQRTRPCHGRRRGRFDGDTLVVETTNFAAARTSATATRPLGAPEITERFTPVEPNKLDWRVTIDDPDV